MKENFDFQEYFSNNIQNFVSDVIRATLKNPRESLFMARFAASVKAASRKRLEAEKNGEHIPAFLIASITSNCNLHCAGCYSRQNHACSDEAPVDQLSAEDWDRVFSEAEELGVSFILLAGGEPLLRRDVIAAAANHESILFPIFTNGVFVSDRYLDLFDRSRNLVPIISIEGDEAATDGRRGEGVYRKVTESMKSISGRGIVFGASVTVTTENMEVFSDAFLGGLADLGCKAVIFVEFVPVTDEARHLAPGDAERAYMRERIARLRETEERMVYVAFPGDEKNSGGCVAAGRGFFHINSHGGAEPCPFSPYSDSNVKETSLGEALHSRLFEALRTEGVLQEDHAGGCVLFEKREQVEQFLAESAEKKRGNGHAS